MVLLLKRTIMFHIKFKGRGGVAAVNIGAPLVHPKRLTSAWMPSCPLRCDVLCCAVFLFLQSLSLHHPQIGRGVGRRSWDSS